MIRTSFFLAQVKMSFHLSSSIASAMHTASAMTLMQLRMLQLAGVMKEKTKRGEWWVVSRALQGLLLFALGEREEEK